MIIAERQLGIAQRRKPMVKPKYGPEKYAVSASAFYSSRTAIVLVENDFRVFSCGERNNSLYDYYLDSVRFLLP